MAELRPPGRLKLFLGFAAGVGKTYRMLLEAPQAKAAGQDVVIGYFEPHGRKDTIALTEGLETVPRRRLEYRGTRFEEMDTDAILRRAPRLCLVDEFAHTNVPGCERAKRWEDVLILLDAGIDVLTTMNVQHLESLNDQVFQISGVRVRETLPDWVMQRADEVIMVDLTPRALLNRLERGVIYEPAKARSALANFFRETTLAALRELALRQTAHEVEIRQEEAPAPPSPDGGGPPAAPPVAEKILVYVTADPSAAMVIRRARRVADYLKAECFAVHVHLPENADEESEAVERHLNFARNLHIETRALRGQDIARTLIEFARLRRVTQIFLARPLRRRWFAPSLVSRIVRLSRDMQITLVASRRTQNAEGRG